MPVCDGCGAQVDDAHIRARIKRLEMATRYRPIHIQVLLVGVAPPPRPEDYLYRTAESGTDRSPGSRVFLDTLIHAAGENPARFATESEALTEFQRRGIFLAHVVECPAVGSEREAALERCATSLAKRTQRPHWMQRSRSSSTNSEMGVGLAQCRFSSRNRLSPGP